MTEPPKIDFFASERQYLDHILPIYRVLPDSLRGRLFVATELAKRCADVGVPCLQSIPRGKTPIVVAGHGDYRVAGKRPVIYVEHGAGQTYLDQLDHPAYSGGSDRDRVILFICPNETVAERNLARYPSAAAAIVGCPRLDPWHPAQPFTLSSPPTVAITFHADLRLNPEVASGYREFLPAIPLLLEHGYRVLGHSHPRLYRRLERQYQALEVPYAKHFSQVLDEADVLCVDNSSTAFEFASIGKPIVWLTPSFYRRDVHHSLRFWDALVLGPEATTPTEVPQAVRTALAPVSPPIAATRDEYLSTVYTYRDGMATARAVAAIERIVEEGWED